jgi:hypothetical protein
VKTTTIFVFDFSLPTARKAKCMAIDDQGRPLSSASFDDATYPYRRWVMGADNQHTCTDADLQQALLETHLALVADYKKLIDGDAWTVVWLDDPRTDERFKAAIRAREETLRGIKNDAVGVLLEILIDAFKARQPTQPS